MQDNAGKLPYVVGKRCETWVNQGESISTSCMLSERGGRVGDATRGNALPVTLEPLSDAVIAWSRGLTTMEGLAPPLPGQVQIDRSGVLGLLCAFTCVQNYGLRLHEG